MKIEWNKKYTTIAIYSLIVICISLLFYEIISQVSIFKNKVIDYLRIFTPFVIGFVMAYLFNFILKFYENQIKNYKKLDKYFLGRNKFRRIFGMTLTYITVGLIIYVLSNFIFPQILSSLRGIINNIPGYLDETSQLLVDINRKLSLNPEYSKLIVEKWDELVTGSIDFLTDLIPMFGNMIKNIISSIWNIILGVIVSIYLLIDKENFIALIKKITLGLFSEPLAERLIEIANRSNFIFSKFIGGKILDSTIVGILTFLILSIFKMPFTTLVSFIIGVTNIIPFFGPFIGAVPSAIIILFESPIKAFWFLIIILIIQQIDGNIIGPKILGDSLGISAFWILFSLMVTGKLIGFIGLIIGVPLFTLVYSLLKDFIEWKLEKKGLPRDTSEYIDKR